MACEDQYFLSVPKSLNETYTAKMLAYSLASGYSVSDWTQELQKRGLGPTLEELDTFWEVGETAFTEETEVDTLEKRWGWAGSAAWKKSASHQARVIALSAVSTLLEGCGDSIVELTRSAICATTNGNYGCFSWSGGGHTFLCSLGHSIIQQGISDLGTYAMVSEHSSHCFRGQSNNWHSCCLSNRASGCS